MIDGYSKVVLTVIAAALCALTVDRFAPREAAAQIFLEEPYPAYAGPCGQTAQRPCYVEVISDQCGSGNNPCFVDYKPNSASLIGSRGLPVRIVN